MAKDKKTSPLAQLRASYAAGDVRLARSLARTIVSDAASDADDRLQAQALLDRTAPDGRATAIGLLALALAAFVVGIFFL